MPPFPKPRFAFDYAAPAEIARLRRHKAVRGVPPKADDHLLIATWNIANLGAQERRDEDHRVIAEILGWFDLIAVQEARANFAALEDLRRLLGPRYRVLFSDTAGNDERMAFLYDTRRATLLEKVGEISVPPAQLTRVKLPGVRQAFGGFDRTPYLAAFQVGPRSSLLLVNVHLFYGSAGKRDVDRRALETFAVARWAEQRRKSRYSFCREVIALGDFNMPKKDTSDPIFRALTSRGLQLPEHTSEVGSSLASDKHYDQIAFFPGATKNCFRQMGVFDFDAVLFRRLWERRGKADYDRYVRYYISDHRPLWMELAV